MPRKLFIVLFVTALFSLPLPATIAGTTPPLTNYTQTPSSPDGKNNWYVSPVEFLLEATDLESGVKEINYRIDGGTWQKVLFSDTLNLAPNPSFTTAGGTTSGLASWEASVVDPEGSYSQDTADFAPGFSPSSAKITATGGSWHGINNKDYFAVANQYENMTASVWLKTQNATGSVYFAVYAIADDGAGGEIVQQVAQSSAITGSTGWTLLSTSFVVTLADAHGVYLDIGLAGPGTLWADAITINSSTKTAQTTVTISSDSADHRLEFYAVDNAGNTESYSCATPEENCVNFKLDMTAPGNWHDSGAFRGLFGPSNHHLFVYTNVEDATAGLSVFTDKYQYHTDANPGFGRFSNLMKCSSDWLADQWAILISPPFIPGAHSAFLLTPKTDFCNSDWKICKTVKFYAEDMAGNSRTKDYCINGPWIKFRGEGIVHSNSYIDMLAEPEGDNTDGLIEIVQNTIDFFTSSKDWDVRNTPVPQTYNYTLLWEITDPKTEITDNKLKSSSGVFLINGNFTIENQSIPSGYASSTFSQIVFVNGDLTISKGIGISDSSTALFIVNGDVKIDKNVNEAGVAILADGSFYTAHNVGEDETAQTLELAGIFSADKFVFQRTLQGTNNDDFPSEDFTFEPKYLVQLKDYFRNYTVQWKKIE